MAKARPSQFSDEIDWERVIDQGTGFFGRRNYQGKIQPPDWQARLITFRQIQTPLDHLMRARQACRAGNPDGQMRDFLTACCLCLAELSAEHARTPKRSPKYLPKGSKITPYLWPEIEQLKQMAQETASSYLKECLHELLTKRLGMYVSRERTRTRPPSDKRFRLVWSGLARYLDEQLLPPPLKREPPRHQLLVSLLKGINPPLPIKVTKSNFKQAIHDFRGQRHSQGRVEIETLGKWFHALRQKSPAIRPQ